MEQIIAVLVWLKLLKHHAFYYVCFCFIDDWICLIEFLIIHAWFIYVETKSEITLSAHEVFSEFFTAQVLTELCRQLVLNYFPLREDELNCWLTDPENFSEF